MYKTILLGTAIALSPLSALAAVQTIPLSDATRGIAPTINVCPGIGYNLSFLEVQGGVAWAKIDDPSQVHVSFETRDLTKSPAKLIHLQRIEQLNFKGIPKSKSTLLTVFTTSKKLLRFRVAYTCPNRFDTGIVEGAMAEGRSPSIAQRSQSRRQPRLKSQPKKDPVVPKPKAQVSSRKTSSRVSATPQIAFSKQFVVSGNLKNLYGLESNPKPEEVEEAPLEEDPGEVPPSRIAWHLTRGLHQARLRKEINYNTRTYRKWQSVIGRVRRGQSLESAITSVGASTEVGAVLLKYGGCSSCLIN